MKVLLLFIFILAGCNPLETGSLLTLEETDGYQPLDATGALAQTIHSFLLSKDFNGVALVAAQGEIILHEGFGLAHTDGQIPMDPFQKFHIASLSKSFAAVGILQLAERGLLSLDMTLDEFFPAVYRSHEITIHHLLTHTSGLFSGDDLSNYSYPTETFDLIQYAFYPWAQNFEEIGEGTLYSNLGYDLLGAIVETVSGMPYEKYLQTYILDILGMPDSGLNREGELFERLATAYGGHISQANEAPVFHPSFGFSSGGMHSTVMDLFHYIQALTLENSLLSFESFQTMTSPHSQIGQWQHGYGFFIDAGGTGNTISHTGNLLGWHGVLIQELNNDATVILLTNHSAGSDMSKGFSIAQLVIDFSQRFP